MPGNNVINIEETISDSMGDMKMFEPYSVTVPNPTLGLVYINKINRLFPYSVFHFDVEAGDKNPIKIHVIWVNCRKLPLPTYYSKKESVKSAKSN